MGQLEGSSRGRRGVALAVALATAAAVSACEVVRDDATTKQDTTTLPGVAPQSSAGALADSAAGAIAPGVPASPSDSARAALVADDTGVVRIHPAEPRRGGVIFALAEGVATPTPRCTWKSAPIPCHRVADGVLVTIPLPADEEPGTFTLTVDRPNGRIVRQVTVADRDFGRELVFLGGDLYDRISDTRTVARDARAVRAILSVQSPERRWSGQWRRPVEGARSEGYGVERYYFRASDSSRTIALESQPRSRGSFAADTSEEPFKGAPGWRHAGIDIAARGGAAVSAAAAGQVADVSEYSLTGRTVLLDHGRGVFSAYFHLDTALLRRGDLVRSGQRIGRVGSTGLATGPHLHYGVYVHGRDVDPDAWREMPAWARGDTSGTATPADTARRER